MSRGSPIRVVHLIGTVTSTRAMRGNHFAVLIVHFNVAPADSPKSPTAVRVNQPTRRASSDRMSAHRTANRRYTSASSYLRYWR